ncbi:MAG: hypothetical protein OEX12_01055 [Gammaproteobacteria bacterium]|nr:hypothetical protein [Gammaproteobacteria bacterium]
MSFNQSKFASVGPSSTEAPNIYTYQSNDSIQAVTGSGYFFNKRLQLEPDDIIFALLSGNPYRLIIGSDTSTAEIYSDFDVISTSADHSTAGDEIISCNNDSTITITLNPNPVNGEEVIVKRRNAPVVISGPIDGSSSKTINTMYGSPHLVYISGNLEWSII